MGSSEPGDQQQRQKRAWTGGGPSYGTGTPVWLFRHGEVHADWQGKAYGGLDVPLSAQGQADTERVAERFAALPFRAVVSSDLNRARTLGERLAERSGAPLTVSSGLAEIARGRWQGRTVTDLFENSGDEVAAFYSDPWTFNGHGGETDADVIERAWPVLAAALESGQPGDTRPIALTAHYNVVRALVAYALGVRPAASFRLRVDLGAISVLRDTPAGWRLARLNVREPRGPIA